MVKKVKDKKKTKKEENDSTKETKKNISVLSKNIKEKREMAKKKKVKTIKEIQYKKKKEETKNKTLEEEEELKNINEENEADEEINENDDKNKEEEMEEEENIEKSDEDKEEDYEDKEEDYEDKEEDIDNNEEDIEDKEEKIEDDADEGDDDNQQEEEDDEDDNDENEEEGDIKKEKNNTINEKEKKKKRMDKEEDNEEEEDKKESKDLILLKKSISEHYYTFQYPKDLYTLLYTSLIFKWIDTTKILILCNTPKEGYKIDLFLRQFRFNTIYLDKEMPLNTNNHFYSQYLKNIYQICIINIEYSEKSKNFAKEILNNTKVPITIIYFDCFSQSLLEYHSFHPNTRSIYHFISNKEAFLDAYENLDENINFNEFVFDKEQMEHLRYRAEDMINGIRKNDIKKEKMRKINIELLHSKKMQKFFKENPKERENIIRNIEENTIKNFDPSASFLPSYLIHNENNPIADAIKKEYKDNKRINKNKRRKKQKKMEQYFEALDKGDGSQNLIQF